MTNKVSPIDPSYITKDLFEAVNSVCEKHGLLPMPKQCVGFTLVCEVGEFPVLSTSCNLARFNDGGANGSTDPQSNTD